MQMQVHPRVFVVQQAKTDLMEAMLKIEQEHKLTASEIFMILSEYQVFISGQCVRTERKGVKDESQVKGQGSQEA
jgi:hypothetical protein